MTLLTAGTVSFTYDAIGSLTSDPSGVSYAYSSLNKLKTSTLGSAVTAYSYGPDGSRAVKLGPDGVSHLYIRGPGGLLAEYDKTGASLTLTREYLGMGSQPLAAVTLGGVPAPTLSVSIATPSQGATVTSGTNVTLTASASATGATIARVEYYNGGILIGQSTSAPYSVTWNNLPLPTGTYTFIARLVTTDGHAIASAPVSITVQ